MAWFVHLLILGDLFSHYYSFCHCVTLSVCPSTGSQMDAKESDMSDTLSPSKDRSSDDTSGKQITRWVVY